MSSATKKKGLGRGLEVLLGADHQLQSFTDQRETVKILPLSQLQAGKYQPRTQMDETSLQELAQSIRTQGIMQPILIRAIKEGQFEIIAGERRFRAAKLAGLNEVPVLIRQVDDQAAAAMALIENIQREDLNPLEEAQGIQRLLDEFDFTHEQVAQAVGRSRSAVTNLLRLLHLVEPVKNMLLSGDLNMGHARALLVLSASEQVTLAHYIVNHHLSVRETEKLVTRTLNNQTKNKIIAPVHGEQDTKRLENQLADCLSTLVKIKMKTQQKGQLVIHFADLDALQGILTHFNLEVD